MASVLFIVLSFLLVLPSATAIGKVCGNAGNYTANGTYQSNLAFLAATLPTNTSSSPQLFATATAGQAPGDVVYALALCRGDLTGNLTGCSACVNGAFQYAQRMCPNAKAASVYDDDCLVGYSSDNILVPAFNVTRDMSTLFDYWNNAATTPGGNATQVAADVKDLLTQTAQQAAARPSRFVTAYMDASSTAIPTLYSLAQCTPDLSDPRHAQRHDASGRAGPPAAVQLQGREYHVLRRRTDDADHAVIRRSGTTTSGSDDK